MLKTCGHRPFNNLHCSRCGYNVTVTHLTRMVAEASRQNGIDMYADGAALASVARISCG